MEKRSGVGRAERLRSLAIRRQNVVYALLIVIGVQYLARSALGSPSLVSEGAAFIMVGCVGLIMSFTTMDIAGSLKDVAREEGSMTRDIIREGLEGLGKQIGLQIDALGRRMEERMEERDKRMEKRLGQMSASIESMSSDIKAVSSDIKAVSSDIKAVSSDIKAMSEDNRAFFKQMLEAQNLILKKVS